MTVAASAAGGTRRLDVVIAGGGIVGLATAHALLEREGLSLALFEAGARIASHQTGRNSGVVHAGTGNVGRLE